MKHTTDQAREKAIENWKDPVKRAKWSKAIREGQEEYKKWKKEREAKKGELATGDLA